MLPRRSQSLTKSPVPGMGSLMAVVGQGCLGDSPEPHRLLPLPLAASQDMCKCSTAFLPDDKLPFVIAELHEACDLSFIGSDCDSVVDGML